jgi:long-chain fatty acid transport protein
LTINPVIAWKIHPTLSLAVGPTLNYSEADFQRGLDPFPGVLPQGQLRLQGNGWAYGFNAGLRWQPHEKWAFGVSYRSPTSVDYNGTAEFSPAFYAGSSTATTANIRFPQFAVAGVSFRPTEDWNFEFDLDWADWDTVKQITIQNLPSITLNYRSSFMYEFGVTRQLGKGFFASLGYFYSENSSPDHDFTPAIPDTDLHLGSIGVGYKSKHWDCTLAYQFGYNPGREVTGDQSYPSANGNYQVLNHAVNLAATFKF